MAKSSQSVGLRYPAFDIFWGIADTSGDDQESKNTLAIAGGGGSAKSGVGNVLNMCQLDWAKKKLQLETPVEVDTGEELCGVICVHPEGEVVCCGFGAAFRLFVIHENKMVLVGEQLSDEAEETPSVNSVCFSPKGDNIVAGGEDGKVRVWKLQNLKGAVAGARASGEGRVDIAPVCVCAGHGGPVTSVAHHPFAAVVASAAKDGSWRLWQARSGAQLAVMPCEVDPAAAAAEARAGRGGRRPRPAGAPQYRACRFSPDGDAAFTVQSSSRGPATLRRWALREPDGQPGGGGGGGGGGFALEVVEEAHTRPAPVPATCLDVSADGRRVALGTVEGEVVCLDARSLRPLARHRAHDLPVTGISFKPDYRSSKFPYDLASCSADKTFTVMKSRVAKRSLGRTLLLLLMAAFALNFWWGKLARRQFGEGDPKPRFLDVQEELLDALKEAQDTHPEVLEQMRKTTMMRKNTKSKLEKAHDTADSCEENGACAAVDYEEVSAAATKAAEAEREGVEKAAEYATAEQRVAAQKPAAEEEADRRAAVEKAAAEEEERLAAEQAAAAEEEERLAAEQAAAAEEAKRLAAEQAAAAEEADRLAAEKVAAEEAEMLAAEEERFAASSLKASEEERRLAAEQAAAEEGEKLAAAAAESEETLVAAKLAAVSAAEEKEQLAAVNAMDDEQQQLSSPPTKSGTEEDFDDDDGMLRGSVSDTEEERIIDESADKLAYLRASDGDDDSDVLEEL